MNKLFLLLLLCIGTVPGFSQTLFTYGNNAVSKDEFLKAYNKNKTPVTDKEAALREYLDLYTKFKLKVKTAEEQRLDTLSQLKNDLQNFRSQVEENYLNDETRLNGLIDEALNRSRKDIHLWHFSIAIDPSKMADTNKIQQAMNELATQLSSGKNDYDALLKDIAAKYMEVKGSDLGFVTAFSLPYEMENLVYNLKSGEVSRVYRSRSAWHLFKNLEERESPGRWRIAQILIAIPPGATENDIKPLEKKSDSIYSLLAKGADFSALAKQISEDQLTFLNGGEMPEFGTGKFDPSFEAKVFELKKDGDISRPIRTAYGFHIIKRLAQRDIPADKSDEAFVAAVKQQVLEDNRVNGAKADFLKEVKQKTGYKRNVAVTDAMLFRYADSVANTGVIKNYPVTGKVIFSFIKQNVKGSDWLNFVKDYKLNRDVYKGESNKELLEKYISTTSFDYYRKHLDEYNKEFKAQLQEFKEGNMLFEIMERNVWSKATNDSIGLQKYYKEHQAGYQWGESAAILLFNCTDSATALTAIEALKNGKDWRQLAEESEGKIQSDSGRYEISQLQIPEGTDIKEGLITTPVLNNGDNTSSFIKVLRLFPAKQQRSFEEARGLVINEYQGFLESIWLNELKKKYPVKVNEAVFQSLLKQ